MSSPSLAPVAFWQVCSFLLSAQLLGGCLAERCGHKGVLSLGTAQRNIAAAILVGGQSFDDPKVLVMVVVVAVIGLVMLMPLARFMGKRSAIQELDFTATVCIDRFNYSRDPVWKSES